MIKNSIQGVKITYNKPSRLYASDGTTLKQLQHSETTLNTIYTMQNTSADGDKLQTFFICDGTETKLELGTRKDVNCGIFDIYINNVLDSSTYDDYASSTVSVYREITLTQPIIKGLNTVELRVNGKNGSSSGYYVKVWGISIQ